MEDELAIARDSIRELSKNLQSLGEELKIYRGSWPMDVQTAISKWTKPLAANQQLACRPKIEDRPLDLNTLNLQEDTQNENPALKQRFVRFLDSLKESTLKHNQAADEYDREIAMDMQRIMMTGSDLMEPVNIADRQSATSTPSFAPTGHFATPLRVCPDPQRCIEAESTLSDLLAELCKAKVEKADIQAELHCLVNLVENLNSPLSNNALRDVKIEQAWEGLSESTRKRIAPLAKHPLCK